MKIATHVMFAQMYTKAGIKKSGDKLVEATVKEYKNIDKVTIEGKTVFTPIDPYMLSYEDNKMALETTNLV